MQVRSLHSDACRGFLPQLFQGEIGDDLTVADDDDVAGDEFHLPEQVAGEEDRPALAGEVGQEGSQPGDSLGIETVERFVEDEHLRVGQQRGSDPEPLPHAQGQL